MPFDLSIEEIRRACGASSYQRGLSYQREGRVLAATWNEKAQAIYGEVLGSGRSRYEQKVFLYAGEKKQQVQGFCSCPMAHNCKHVAAVLLEWIEKNLTAFEHHSQQQTSDLLNWQQATLQRLKQSDKIDHPQPGQTCLLHILKPKKTAHSQVFELHTLRSRLLKRGGWGKVSNVYLSDLTSYNYYASTSTASSLDQEIAHLLEKRYSYGYQPLIEGDIGLLALKRLLRSGRCFYRTIENPPLSLGPRRRAIFEWQEKGATTQLKIVLENGSDNWLLLPTQPPWYLDVTQHQCGPIEQPLTPALLQSLLTMPAVATDQLTDLSYFLLKHTRGAEIPLPVDLQIKTIDEAPQPTLILHSISGIAGQRHHLARLRFGYGELSLPPQPINGADTELIHHSGQDWQIKRHQADELAARQTLFGYNFIPSGAPLAQAGELDLLFDVDSLTESALSWKMFLKQLPQLEAAGWLIDIDDSFVISFETASILEAEVESEGNDWFELGLNIEHEGHKIALLPLLLQWLKNDKPDQPLLYQLQGNRWLEIPASVLEPVIETLVELFQDPLFDDSGRIRLPRSQAHSLLELETRLDDGGHHLNWLGGHQIRQLAEKLKNFSGIDPVAAPAGLTSELREYQQQGLAWLQFLREYQFNGVLADDMGLGKTIQTLAHLLIEKENGRLDLPVLIVAPTSVLGNWLRETARFTPQLKCLLLHGPQRSANFGRINDYDLIITSYHLLTRDLKQHQSCSYHSLILDEAQAIKNPRAQSALAASKINTRHRLCLTGTPLENHLGELWSLFNFLMPGFLSNQKNFTRIFRTPIEKHRDTNRQKQLQQRIAPFVLRRNKEQVACELPPKTIMIRTAELTGAQARLYESLRLAMLKKVNDLLENKGLQRGHIEILDALLKLRQVCCDPRLVKLASARKVNQSAKLEELLELLEKLLSENRRILIFSQFTSMLSLIETELQTRDIGYSKLTGQTRKRDEVIDEFQNGQNPVFLISLKAGGVGLNLTAADTVIHYDPWWNPAVENQATDRAHRIGQDKPVFVYKLVASGTIEEKILQLQERKQQLANAVYQDGEEKQPLSRMQAEDILALLTPITN